LAGLVPVTGTDTAAEEKWAVRAHFSVWRVSTSFGEHSLFERTLRAEPEEGDERMER
jgi:hypothetical protein